VQQVADHTIAFDTAEVGPFSAVDGQHRLEGLKMAAQKDDRVLNFEVSVNIAINLLPIAQMCHFLIVNTTQKSVDKSVEQRIIARLTDALDVTSTKPKTRPGSERSKWRMQNLATEPSTNAHL
jgi:hypothetical protein